MAIEKDKEKTKTKKPKVTFEENLAKIKDETQPLHLSALYTLSSMTPERQSRFEQAWQTLGSERRLKIASSLNDLTEEVVELDFTSVYTFLLQDTDAKIRAYAVEGLDEDESRAVLGEFLRMLDSDSSQEVREKIAKNLGHFAYLAELEHLPQRWRDRLHNELLAQLNKPNSPEVERRLVEALGYFDKDEQVTKIIERSYQSDNELLKAAALRAMGRNLNPRWLPEIGKEMSSTQALLRYEAAIASGELASRELLPSLVKLTQDNDREVRAAACWALGQIGGPEATRILKTLLTDEAEAVREAAQEAIEEIAYHENPINPLGGQFGTKN